MNSDINQLTFALAIGKLKSHQEIYHNHYSLELESKGEIFHLNLNVYNTKVYIFHHIFENLQFIKLMNKVSDDYFINNEQNEQKHEYDKLLNFDYQNDFNFNPSWLELKQMDKEQNINAIKDLLSTHSESEVLAYGVFYQEDEYKKFNLKLINPNTKCYQGIHFLHFNQGWSTNTKYTNFNHKDGILILKNPTTNIFSAILIFYNEQSLPVDNKGNPIN